MAKTILQVLREITGIFTARTIAELIPALLEGSHFGLNVFNFKGAVATTASLPISGNTVGDIYFVSEDGSERIWVTSESRPNGYWEKLGVDVVVDAAAVALAIHAMTAAQKAGVLSDIGAASSGDLPDVSDVVRTSIQDLSPNAQEQARLNIGAVTQGDVDIKIMEEPLLRYDTAQLSITDAQKAQVRTNIGAEAKISDLAAIRSGAQAGATAVQPNDISGKLDVSQGIANAGKFIVVGSDGNITAVTMQTWQGGNY